MHGMSHKEFCVKNDALGKKPIGLILSIQTIFSRSMSVQKFAYVTF